VGADPPCVGARPQVSIALSRLMYLHRSLAAYTTPDFGAVFKSEVEQFDASHLPLQQALQRSSQVSGGFSLMLIAVTSDADAIRVRAGIFYAGVIGGCSCADDPTPHDEISEYCKTLFVIDRHSAATTLTLLD
jgi:hypothetical protein